MTPNAFSLREFARRNSVSVGKLYKEAKAGRLKLRKIGRKTVVLASDEAEWLASLPSYDAKPAGKRRFARMGKVSARARRDKRSPI